MVFYDPNDDTDGSDTKIEFRSWNRALYKWNDIATVAVTGDISSDFRPTLSIGYDSSTGVFAVASEHSDGELHVFVSSDNGVTWTEKAALGSSDTSAAGPSVALRGGTIHLAYVIDHEGLKYVTGKLTSDPATWITTPAPQISKVDLALPQVSPSLALDSAGNPGVAWWANDLTQDYNSFLMFWKPTSGGAPVTVMDTQNNSGDLDVKLAYFQLNPRVLVYAQRNDAGDGVGLHVSKSDDGGLSWSVPVVIPPDGDSSTNYPFDLALDSQGTAAIFR